MPRAISPRWLTSALSLVFLASFLFPCLSLAVPAGTIIENEAFADYTFENENYKVPSNPVSLEVVVVRTPSVLEFLEYAPEFSGAEQILIPETFFENEPSGLELLILPLDPPLPLGSDEPLDLSKPIPLVPSDLYHQGEPLFLRLTDLDQNLDPEVQETILVTLKVQSKGTFGTLGASQVTTDQELLQLTEIHPNSGIFAGYVQLVEGSETRNFDGKLSVAPEDEIEGNYVDVVDGSDQSRMAALVDPFNRVFSSTTGQLIDRATITLVDARSGEPALVYGDDGLSVFPSSISAGETVNDESGRIYPFPEGSFRFPVVPRGEYRLVVDPPDGFEAPSRVSEADLQRLPGSPYALDAAMSRGEVFTVEVATPLYADIPIDPVQPELFLTKATGSYLVNLGDFVPYTLSVENTGQLDLANVQIEDRLPAGFRYVPGTAYQGGSTLPDPAISEDGSTLVFSLGALDAGQAASVSYVAVIGPGAPEGEARNVAVAEAEEGLRSNLAHASVRVHNELFQDRGFIVGTVWSGECDNPDSAGVYGARVYLDDGTYAVTDSEGRFHFEGVTPGTHVVQLDVDGLPPQFALSQCEDTNRHAGRGFSQFVDIQGGTVWRTDFHVVSKPLETGFVKLALESQLTEDRSAVDFEIDLRGTEVPTRNLRLTVLLPDSLEYESGSSRDKSGALLEPELSFGVLTYRLGNPEREFSEKIRLRALMGTGAIPDTLVAKTILTFDTPDTANQRTELITNELIYRRSIRWVDEPAKVVRPQFDTFIAELRPSDEKMLDELIEELRHSEVTDLYVEGHTDSVRINPARRDVFADNNALSEARAQSVAAYLGNALNIPASRVTVVGKGLTVPVAPNATAEGRAMNRRVEVRVHRGRNVSESEVLKSEASASTRVETIGLRPGDVWQVDAEKVEEMRRANSEFSEVIDSAWLEATNQDLQWLWPDPNLGPAIPALKLMLKHDAAHKVKIAINGRETSALLFDNQVINLAKTVAVTTWRGLPLSEGDNLIVVQCFDENGEVQARTERTIHYASAPVRAELIKDRSVLTADGTTQPILAIRFLDKDGYPAREGVVGSYEIDAPYIAQQAIDDLQDRPVVGNNRGLRFVVGPDGMAWIRLQPTTQSGEVTLRLPFPQWEQEVRAWLQPAPRDWILVGFAEGTVGYNTLSENVETIPDRGGDGEIYEDGQVSFFAKGQIKGEWLLTVALNSDRKPSREQLFRQIDPNAYYSLYADRTVQQYDAQSTGPLYVKLERAQFYALFGDFQTGMTVTELSRYNRVFRGFKTEYASPSANITGFVTDTRQGFAKEEIRGDGVSGPYALSANNLVLNSEHVYIETRDRFRTEIVTSRTTLARHLDYTINYRAGTLTFREPVFSRDADLNPIFIVVDYETYTTAEASLNYGVRGELGTSNQRIRAGATYVHEEGGTAEGDLIGADAEVFLRAATRLRAEVAHSSRTRVEGNADALAYLGELEHQSAIASGRLYYREQEEGFGFGQQNLTEAASRKFGAEAKSELGSRFNLKGLAYRHRNLSTDANRDVIESDLELIQEYVTLRSGFRFAQDKLEDGSLQISRQITTGANSSLWKGRVDLRLQHDQSLDGANANQAYPTRTLFGASLKLTDDWKLFGEEELTHGDSGNTTISRVGVEAKPWAGSTVTSSVERQPGDAGSRLRSNFGLKQSLQLSEHWLVDGGLEHSNTTLTGSGDAIFPNAPSPSGSGQDFVAFFGGGAYQDVHWSASGRLEFRFTDSDDRVFVTLGATGEPKPGLGLGLSGRLSFASGSNGNKRSEHALRLALAHRPREHNWTILDKLELHTLKETGTANDSESWRVVNNFGSNWRFGRGQVSAQYGSKYARYELVGQDLSGYTDLLGAELRHDLSDIFDIGLRGQSLHGYKSGTMDYSAGVSLGMNLLENSWVSLGYNLLGFHDEDFSRASYTAQGPFLTFRLKFDQATVRSLVGGDR